VSDLPQRAARPQLRGISSDELRSKVDQFLSSRGYKSTTDAPVAQARPAVASSPSTSSTVSAGATTAKASVPRQTVADFVCEDDVRQALRAGTRILIGERTIVTPSARDLGEAQHVFTMASWPT
jgi:hypothetical protein